MERFDNPRDVGDRHGQGRHKDDHIAQGTKDDAVGAEAVADEVADSAGRIEGAARGFVFHEFDAGHEAFLADVADVGEILEGLEKLGELCGFGLDLVEEIVFLEEVERGDGRGAGEWIPGVGVAVEEGFSFTR